ncbi:hypothetical protein PLICRDRAFT_151866 [Plicaturopsis crispa FD-325 SS-3]|nr:hypothetical protein PLICRDRAFT_151866 [Plicaturopsis crispa FD-325 SS-3]
MPTWEVKLSSRKGVPYFYDKESGQSVWEAPSDLSKDQIMTLPGAQEYLSGPGSAFVEGKPGQVRASHLLVKHKDSRRPSSWKARNITRTKEEAIEQLREWQLHIGKSPVKFGEVAQVHSDCSSHSNQGDLGWFGPGQMQKPFEEATYALKVNEISDVIETDSGVHLILRTG